MNCLLRWFNQSNLLPPSQLQLNKANVFYTKAAFLDLHLSIVDGFVSCKICDNAMILILRLKVFLSWMVMFLVRHPTVFIFHN